VLATAERDQATILFALCDEPERIVPNWRIVDKIWNAYIRVDGVESVYAEVLPVARSSLAGC
jgi:hypothetical protein